jgi:hypothetical protein
MAMSDFVDEVLHTLQDGRFSLSPWHGAPPITERVLRAAFVLGVSDVTVKNWCRASGIGRDGSAVE